jgi:hypothetical protein
MAGSCSGIDELSYRNWSIRVVRHYAIAESMCIRVPLWRVREQKSEFVVKVGCIHDRKIKNYNTFTMYQHDLTVLDLYNACPRGPWNTFETANGDIELQTLIIKLQLLCSDCITPIGDWFDEIATIDEDVPESDTDGQQLTDADGAVVHQELRLTGALYRNTFFCGSGPYSNALILSTTKTEIVNNIHAKPRH